ncbi:MAG: NAD(P)H-dependent oxidoreductase subunit E [Bacteroidetes bacterium]|jgi:NADH-quinone oxidoreductase subunit F|nr:NAD(P)H-dependent oxidoreductase subunit E [Bacteroidota bacterium]
MSKNLSELTGRKGLKYNLFDKLGNLSLETGTPSKEALSSAAEDFLIGKANTYGTATFYDFMRPENQGKKAYVCNGSACLCAGTQEGVRHELEKHFKENEIGEMCCLGRCHENGAFHINGKNYSGKAANEIAQIATEGRQNGTQGNTDRYRVHCHGTQVLTGPMPGIDAYFGILLSHIGLGQDTCLEQVKLSNIRGRGGAGFPMWIKLDGCRKALSDQKFIVCNADEGDPGAYTDRYLLEQQPFAVLWGMMMAGFITGSDYGALYIRAEYPESVEVIETAIRQLESLGWLGENIKGSGFSFHFKVIKAQGAYICGEETALLNSIEGQRPEVRVRPPYPVVQGLFNKPTVVNNVETLAALPYILKHGGAHYASIGRGKCTGTKLLSLDSHFTKPGVYEVDMGTPLHTVVYELAGGFAKAVKALHIGGPLGGLVPMHMIDKLTIDFESFAEAGFLLGHASIICVPHDFPMVAYLEHLFAFTSHESCGKCFPCRLGAKRGAEMFAKAREGSYKIDRTLLHDLIHTMETGSLCALGGGVPLPIRNGLAYFEEELRGYLA